jgi:transcriptional regulator with XRE-family HTH domain
VNNFQDSRFFVESTISMNNVLLDPIEQYVIDTVRRMRIEKKYSQKELAFMLDLSIGFIGDVESSKERAKYNLSHINKLAEIFECSPKDFLPEKPLT